jgi:hypothetical protein
MVLRGVAVMRHPLTNCMVGKLFLRFRVGSRLRMMEEIWPRRVHANCWNDHHRKYRFASRCTRQMLQATGRWFGIASRELNFHSHWPEAITREGWIVANGCQRKATIRICKSLSPSSETGKSLQRFLANL